MARSSLWLKYLITTTWKIVGSSSMARFPLLVIPISSPAFLWSLFYFLWFWFERHVLCMWLIWWVSENLCTVVQSLDRFESEVHVSLIFLHDTQKIYIWFCWGGFWLYLLINVGSKLIHFEWLAYCGSVKLAFSVLWWLCITNLGTRIDFVNNSFCIITTMLYVYDRVYFHLFVKPLRIYREFSPHTKRIMFSIHLTLVHVWALWHWWMDKILLSSSF